MSNIVEMVVAVVLSITASSGFWAFIQLRMNNKSASSKMLLGLGHDRIISLGLRYLERGWITFDEYEDLKKYLYDPYIEMGGNGSAQALMADVDQLKKVTREEASKLRTGEKEKEDEV